MKVCLTGDVFLGGDLLRTGMEGGVAVESYWAADVRVINLEHPVSDSSFVEEKSTLFTGTPALRYARAWKVDVAGLANNHIHDKGPAGIVETCANLDRAGIRHFGAGATITEAARPLLLDEATGLLGYCDFGRPYLKQIAVAGDATPGVNPLRYERIVADLDQLPEGTRAILCLHWGREHVWFPPHHDLELARRLLEDDRVALIVGMHAHRVQGFLEHNGKRAYMCVGNFIFPNFYIAPPTRLMDSNDAPPGVDVTRQYHSVARVTYKRWRGVNRVSLLVFYNTATGAVDHAFTIQDDDRPLVTVLRGAGLLRARVLVRALSACYAAPHWMYRACERVMNGVMLRAWAWQIRLFWARQRGWTSTVRAFADRWCPTKRR